MKWLLANLIILLLVQPLSGQMITVRLLDGKTGKPMVNKNITFHWGSTFETTIVRVGTDGTGKVSVPNDAKAFALMPGPKDGNEPYRLAYLDCNEGNPLLNVQDVLEQGIVPHNECSSKTTSRKPGEVVFWGLTRRWYQLDMQ